MFIAMNWFRVAKGSEDAFERVWLNRDSQLNKVPGFVEFHLLKGPEAEDHTLYASHTVWQSKSAFEAWTKSEAFRAAHARAGNDIRIAAVPDDFVPPKPGTFDKDTMNALADLGEKMGAEASSWRTEAP